ncbi:MAG: hypothetical protein FWG63_02895 [Defluviitaleaceae bacterium]|nr:hypothetical protein [Defluviitaleaceae bacterium]
MSILGNIDSSETTNLSISGLVSEITVAGESLHFNIRQFIFMNFSALFIGFVGTILVRFIPTLPKAVEKTARRKLNNKKNK